MFTKNVFTQKDPIADLVKPMLEAQTKTKMEELKGNQAVLDKNKNNKLDADDFKILRGEKKAVKEENVEESSPFDWKKPREPEVKGGAGIKKGRAYGGAAQKSKPEQDDADEKKKTQKEEVEQQDEAVETKKEFMDRQKRLAAASAETQKDPERLKRLSKIPGYTAAMDLAKKTTTKEEVESKEKEDKDDIPFDGPYKKKDSAKAGKHGAGYSTARHLAQMGMKKALKKEEVEQVDELNRSTVKSYIDKKTDKIHSSAGTTSSLPGAKDLDSLQRAHARLVGNKPTTAKKTGDIQVDVRNKKITKNEEVEQVEERTLTKGETAEKERIVKGMKKSLAGFKARYGEKAKSVMYATATKAAKKD